MKLKIPWNSLSPLKIYIILFFITIILIIGISKSYDKDEDEYNYKTKYDDPYFNRFDKIDRYEVKDIYL
jgi:hypothetical protein